MARRKGDSPQKAAMREMRVCEESVKLGNPVHVFECVKKSL